MAPSIENEASYAVDEWTPQRNVTFAVNYELSIVDQFLASERKKRGEDTIHVENVPESTALKRAANSKPSSCSSGKNENKAPNVIKEKKNDESTRQATVQTPSRGTDSKRRSAREKKRDLPLSRSRVRYDMQQVPPTRRNKQFLTHFPSWWLPASVEEPENGRQPRRSSRLSYSDDGSQEQQPSKGQEMVSSVPLPPPFEENSSVVWIPSKRSEWEDTVSEMTAVCTSAAIRRFKVAKPRSTAKPFHAPLSRDYIRDRVDIDDPLNGFQIRHKTGGWLQGFLMWTQFTTWTYYFKWDSKHPKSGISNLVTNNVDADGSLANELEHQERFGDPHESGIIFPSIAEIALVGGLGCGEYLLRMALESIIAAKKYKYVVLQATDQSKTFYERFGFVRVGAVCRYGIPVDGKESPIVGYCHWTHANESETSLQMHGGPSYMMCLKLPETDPFGSERSAKSCPISFLDHMMKLKVEGKPTIEQLGSSLTPGPKPPRSASLPVPEPVPGTTSSPVSGHKRKYTRRGSDVSGVKRRMSTGSSTKPSVRRSSSSSGDEVSEPCKKRRKLASPVGPKDGILFSPPRANATVSRVKNGELGAGGSFVASNLFDSSKKSAKKPGTAKGKKVTDPAIAEDASNRSFYSVRGSNGRFVTLTTIGPVDAAPPTAEEKIPRPPTTPRTTVPRKGGPADIETDGKPCPVNKAELLKQKVKSYPRSRVHYYNRVVKPKNGPRQYFFVLNYDEPTARIRIAPMTARGVLSGKREGRPRFQVIIEETDTNFITAATSDYQVVPATMVMKTPVVANEAWDVEDDAVPNGAI